MTACIHYKLGFAIIAFDVCFVVFLPLLTPATVNYSGRLPTTMKTIASVKVVSIVPEVTGSAESYTESKGNSKGLFLLIYIIFLSKMYAHDNHVVT